MNQWRRQDKNGLVRNVTELSDSWSVDRISDDFGVNPIWIWVGILHVLPICLPIHEKNSDKMYINNN